MTHEANCRLLKHLGNFKKWFHWKEIWKQTRFESHFANTVILIWISFCIEVAIWLVFLHNAREGCMTSKDRMGNSSVAFSFVLIRSSKGSLFAPSLYFPSLGWKYNENSFTHSAQFPFVNFWCSRFNSSG